MDSQIRHFYETLSTYSWSLWTELGVAGMERKHKDVAILPEELLLLTSCVMDEDPRLRDEVIDWCCQHHKWMATSKLRTLCKSFQKYIPEDFWANILFVNDQTGTRWPVNNCTNLPGIRLSGKSRLRPFEMPSMLSFRQRAFFGVNARADLIASMLISDGKYFTASDLTYLGYTKRHLSEVLHELSLSGVLSKKITRNRHEYSLNTRSSLESLLGEVPSHFAPTQPLLSFTLKICQLWRTVGNQPIGLKVVALRTLLLDSEDDLFQLSTQPPSLKGDLEIYWKEFFVWLNSLYTST